VTLNLNPLPSEEQGQARNAYWISVITAVVFAGFGLSAILTGGGDQLWSVAPILLASLVAFGFISTGRHVLGSMTLIGVIGLQAIFAPLVQSGVGVPGALGSVALIGGIGLSTLPRRYIGRILMVGMLVAIASILIDLFGAADRPLAGSASVRWAFSLTLIAIFGLFLARQFISLDIRTKIVLGILATGGVALGVLAFFAYGRTEQVTMTLSERLESSVSLLAEEQLINTVFTQANLANQSFEDVMEEVKGLAQNWVSLDGQKGVFSQGGYWDARTNLVPLDAGQYGNSASDVSAVFIPANSEVDDALMAELNTSAYLDFSAPAILESHPALLAIYAIDTRGVIRYYPNINLASVFPPDFDATQRPYFEITAPLFNPRRLPRWTIPYVDATGDGLVVTVAAPVYIKGEFHGVVAADMQLANITRQVEAIKIGQTGFAFMIDDAGRILSMPPAGYKLFGLRPGDVNLEEFFKQTILGEGSNELQAATRRMVAGGSGLLIVNADGVDTYVSFSPVKANGYSVALVVPISELQGAILTARNESQLQIQSAIRLAAIIFIALLFLAVIISLGIGQVIAAPIIRLTQIANQIVEGNLTAQATVGSQDEIGTLAHAFNTMTSRLRESLEGLEQRVSNRTAELAGANERIERRARQFESIAQVARTISSTRDLDSLLSHITTAISNQFGFYHVGIFLLDPRREYAVLSAANSEGGRRMLARNHRLKVGETGIVGFVTNTGQPRVALDTGADAVFFDNSDHPDTRSEIGLPLRVGEEIIGALDVQSTNANAFSHEDINILSTLADQVSIAIQNARQFEETRKALAESESLSRQFVQSGWQQFTKSRNLVGIRHTGAKATILYSKNGKSKEDEDLPNKGQARMESRGTSLILPIKLRGELIGSVEVRSPVNRKWDQDELDIVTAIIERAAIAMENSRLLAESQKRAAKERAIGEISTKISAQADIEKLLQTAAQELGRTMPGAEVVIQFQSKD